MPKNIAELIFAIWQRRQDSYHYCYGKPWKPEKAERVQTWPGLGYHEYPPYGHEYGHPGYHRLRGVKGLIIDAVLRRLLHRR